MGPKDLFNLLTNENLTLVDGELKKNIISSFYWVDKRLPANHFAVAWSFMPLYTNLFPVWH
jgi:hypothetical protein